MRKKLSALLLCAALLCPWLAAGVPALASGEEDEPLRLPVVMYHHVSRDSAAWNDYVISPEELEADLAWLSREGWTSIGVRDLLAWYDGEAGLPEKPFMITFDDGFEGVEAYAEPLLAKYGFCGVTAVIGAVCEKYSRCGEHDPDCSHLSWEDAAAMAGRGVLELQCHTWDMHATWPRLGCQRMRGESAEAYAQALTGDLERFRSECAAHGVETVPAIAYPYGAFGKDTKEICRSLGFRIGFSCRERVNLLRQGEELPLILGRYNRPHGASSADFFSAW